VALLMTLIYSHIRSFSATLGELLNLSARTAGSLCNIGRAAVVCFAWEKVSCLIETRFCTICMWFHCVRGCALFFIWPQIGNSLFLFSLQAIFFFRSYIYCGRVCFYCGLTQYFNFSLILANCYLAKTTNKTIFFYVRKTWINWHHIFFLFFPLSHQSTKANQFFFSFFPLHTSNTGSLFSS